MSAAKSTDREKEGHTQLLPVGETKDVVSLRKCLLAVLEGPSKGTKLDLNTRKITRIGKKEDNDLCLDDPTVSRYHAEIHFTADSYLLKDLQSTNGTLINGTKVREAFLTPGDVVSVGNSNIEFQTFDESVKIEPSASTAFGQAVGKNRKLRQIFGILERISPTLATVIIEGETGTGKELIARGIHDNSLRKNKPFVVFDCSSVAPNLIESELFGHIKGSFTGAIKDRKGAFESATGGTIFLDEIGELSLELQPKLLRALEQREVKPVGSTETLKLDVRVICATNRDLKAEVKAGRFREDLYYRLSVVKVHLPPLRERTEDISLIVEKLLTHASFNRKPDGSYRVTKVDDDALRVLQRYQWPGNVRELANTMERAVSFCDGTTLTAHHLNMSFSELDNQLGEQSDEATVKQFVDTSLAFKEAKQKILEVFERDYIEALLLKYNFNVSKASREAQIDRKHMRNLIKKYNIEMKKKRKGEAKVDVDIEDEEDEEEE